MLAGRELEKILSDYPDLEVETIEITTQPLRALRAGIRLFPALKIGDQRLAGVLLSEQKIRDFIDNQRRS